VLLASRQSRTKVRDVTLFHLKNKELKVELIRSVVDEILSQNSEVIEERNPKRLRKDAI
jgi:hypothetical protein